jgi:cytochrome c oxidase assembly protein subunit 15
MPAPVEQRVRAFRRFAWTVLGYMLLVVLWGAYVRATGSGAGCGGHWPLCNGEIVPRSPAAATLIEYTHRAMSGLSLVLTAGLFAWAFRVFPRGHPARRFAALSGLFLVLEALLGAGLVLFDYVAHNASAGRAAYMSAHLSNTLVLLAMIAMTAWSGRVVVPEVSLRKGPKLVLSALPAAILVGISGALAALGDTLFPAASVEAGIRQELAPSAHALLRLRLLHPAAAVAAGVILLLAAVAALRSKPIAPVRSAAMAVVALFFVQCVAGIVNIALLAPVWMQIVHLLLADLLWIALVFLAAETYSLGNSTLLRSSSGGRGRWLA